MTDNPSSAEAPAEKPIPEYDTLSVETIAVWAASATDAQRELAIRYESANQNRPEVLTALGATPEAPEE